MPVKVKNSYFKRNYLKLFSIIIFFYPFITRGECTFSSGDINLGKNSSFTILNGNIQSSGNSGLFCSGFNATLLTHNTIKAQIVSTLNNMKMKNQDSSVEEYIPYLIYPDKDYQYAYKIGQDINFEKLNLLSVIFASTNREIPLYLKTQPNFNVSSGLYQDFLQVKWEYSICRVGTLFLCFSNWKGTGFTTIKVHGVVEKECLINNINNIDFGFTTSIHKVRPLINTLTVSCTKNEHFNIWFNDGNFSHGEWRQMSDGLGHYIQYNIYHPDTNIIWNKNSKLGVTGSGRPQIITYQVSVNNQQKNINIGHYSDTISIVIEY
ncbi:MAG: spore coat protein U domain-containing protein [Candidatus Dasytiphilus stammeri]